jgi:peptidoglycan/xylan/chitin deacetylase (PgdA/CDA1 family)
MSAALHVVMYHYIRDLPNTPFPRIKGMLSSDFQRQLPALRAQYEIATLESALDFLRGDYKPSRDLCLLTFDDGLKEHYAEVTPLLVDYKIQGIFFPITFCLHEHCVAPVHMNHFLMAGLSFELYRRSFFERLAEFDPNFRSALETDPEVAQRIYRWDTPEVAAFKYVFNFVVDWSVRDEIVRTIFVEKIADERSYCETLYFNWDEAKKMQDAGMLIGGHSHRHRPLSTLSDEELEQDLTTSRSLLVQNLKPQPLWPFSYPYGKRDSFDDRAIVKLRHLQFACSFSTEVGPNAPGANLYALCRIDCKEAPLHDSAPAILM